MKTAKEFRLSFYQGVCDDPNELTPCDDELCIAGISHNTIEYFANCAEAEYELALEDFKKLHADWTETLGNLTNRVSELEGCVRQRDAQIRLLDEKLEEALKNATIESRRTSDQNREGNPDPRAQDPKSN